MATRPYTQNTEMTQPVPSEAAYQRQSDGAHYLRIILMRLWLIILLVAATEGTAAAYMYTQPLVYETSVRFQITIPPPNDVTLYQTNSSSSSVDALTATRTDFLSTLTSLDVAWDTLDTLKLPLSGREVQQMISVAQVPDSDFVILTVRAGDPKQSADLANGLIAAAVKRYGQMTAQPLQSSETFISSQLDQTQTALQQARTNMAAFQASHNLGALDTMISSQVTLIRGLQLNHDEAVAEGDAAKTASYQNLITQRTTELTALINLSSQYDDLQTQIDNLQATHDYLQGKLTQAQITDNQARNLDTVQVFGPARVPDGPNPRISTSIMILAAAVATVVGVLLAFLWEYLWPSRPKPAVRRREAR